MNKSRGYNTCNSSHIRKPITPTFEANIVFRFTFDVPEDTEEIYLTAYYQDSKTTIRAQAETTAYSSYGPEDKHIYIRTNNRYIQVRN